MRRYKKYPNRRLYDLDNSVYVTVEDIRKTILEGESINVVDSTGREDITRSVLLQILAEQEQRGHAPVLTNRVIEQIIRFYDDRFGHFVSSYIEQSILMFLEHQDQYRQRMRELSSLNPLNAMRQAMDMWDPLQPRNTEPSTQHDVEAPDGSDAGGKPDEDEPS